MHNAQHARAPVRLIALCRRPQNEAEFLERFDRLPTPLLRAVPHLRELRISPVSHKRMAGAPGFFLMAEMVFDDPTSFADAMCSRENRVACADLKAFAVDPVTLVVEAAH